MSSSLPSEKCILSIPFGLGKAARYGAHQDLAPRICCSIRKKYCTTLKGCLLMKEAGKLTPWDLKGATSMALSIDSVVDIGQLAIRVPDRMVFP